MPFGVPMRIYVTHGMAALLSMAAGSCAMHAYMRPDLEPPPGLQDKEDARKRAIKEVLEETAKGDRH